MDGPARTGGVHGDQRRGRRAGAAPPAGLPCSGGPWARRRRWSAAPTSPGTCGSPPPTCAGPRRSSATGRASGSRKGSDTSSAGTRRPMDVSPEHLVEQARERFQLQDYYGAIHLLEEVNATGRAFADAHHLLGLSFSLVGQQEHALAQLDRALQLNPQYVEALIHKAIVLNELGRDVRRQALAQLARQLCGAAQRR